MKTLTDVRNSADGKRAKSESEKRRERMAPFFYNKKGRLQMSDANPGSDTRTSKTVSGAGPVIQYRRRKKLVNKKGIPRQPKAKDRHSFILLIL